jgi:hypothetical protein
MDKQRIDAWHFHPLLSISLEAVALISGSEIFLINAVSVSGKVPFGRQQGSGCPPRA